MITKTKNSTKSQKNDCAEEVKRLYKRITKSLIFKKIETKTQSKKSKAESALLVKKNVQSTGNQHTAILEYIKKRPTATKDEMASNIANISISGIKYHISKMQKEGLLTRVGSRRRGRWVVVKRKTKQ